MKNKVSFFLISSCMLTSCLGFFSGKGKAKKFLKKELKKEYGKEFKINSVFGQGNQHRIVFYEFKIQENKKEGIIFPYLLGNEDPFFFYKEKFEQGYAYEKEHIKTSKNLEHDFADLFPNAIASTNKILGEKIKHRWIKEHAVKQARKSRWVQSIYTGMPWDGSEERIKAIDRFCLKSLKNYKEKDVIINLYFPVEKKILESSKTPRDFFKYKEFSAKNKYRNHYRIDLKKEKDEFEIVARKLINNIGPE